MVHPKYEARKAIYARAMCKDFIAVLVDEVAKKFGEKSLLNRNSTVQLLSLVEQPFMNSQDDEPEIPQFVVDQEKADSKDIAKILITDGAVVCNQQSALDSLSQGDSAATSSASFEKKYADFLPKFEPKVRKNNEVKDLAAIRRRALAKSRSKPFVPHSASLGNDLVTVCYRMEEEKNEKKNIKKRKIKDLPPLSSFLRPKKSLFANFVSPVPPNYVLKLQPEVPEADNSQCEEVSSSTTDMQKPEEYELTAEELMSPSYLIFFRDVCPNFVTKLEGCNANYCIHELPNVFELKNILETNLPGDAMEIYGLVKKFKPELRMKYFPVLAEAFARKLMVDALGTMVKDISTLDPFMGFGLIAGGLEQNCWAACDVVRFIIDHHIETELNQQMVRKNILALIGMLKEDVVKFIDYQVMVSGNKY